MSVLQSLQQGLTALLTYIPQLIGAIVKQRVRFLSVGAAGTLGLGKKDFLIFYDAVREESAERVTLDQDCDTVTGSPTLDEEVEPDRRHQRAVYRHYGYA